MNKIFLALAILISSLGVLGLTSSAPTIVIHAETDSAQNEGWVTDSKGKTYIKSDGTKYSNEFVVIDNDTYYFLEDGYVATGWTKINGYSYFFMTQGNIGKMQKGFINLNGYLFYLGTDGRMRTGWQKIDGNWYYFWQSGSAATGWTKIDGSTYFFITSGSRIGQMGSGWMMLNGQKFYLGTDGKMRTGWQKIDEKWYYFWQSGPAATGWTKIDGNSYFFLTSGNIGEMMTGWLKLNGYTFYLGSDGSMRTGWRVIDNKQYYFWSSGAMALGWCTIDGDTYFFSEASAQYGQMMTGWMNLNGNVYYLGSDGSMRTGCILTSRPGYYEDNINNTPHAFYHFFNSHGVLTTDSDVRICSHGNNVYNDYGFYYKAQYTKYTSTISNQNVLSAIRSGIRMWNAIDGVNVQPSTNDNKHIWFQYNSDLDARVLAETRWFYKGEEVFPWNSGSTWDKAIIDINPLAATVSDLDSVIAHEIGHCFGLSHHITRDHSIMYYSDSPYCQYIYQIDVDNLKHIDN